MSKLAAVLMVRDESPYIQEWLAFHTLVGFDYFLIWADSCTDDTIDKINELSFPCTIYDDLSFPPNKQDNFYTWAMEDLAERTEWAICMDVDEFIFPVVNDSLLDVLPNYKHYSGVAVCQVVYGPSGHATPPSGLVIENYGTYNEPYAELPVKHMFSPIDSRWYKTIVQPAQVFRFRNAHFPITTTTIVQEDMRRVPLSFAGTTNHRITDILRINHYFTKSRSEWDAKINKGRPSGSPPYSEALFSYYASLDKEDWVLRDRYAQPVKDLLNEILH
jgi:hypothetical protein